MKQLIKKYRVYIQDIVQKDSTMSPSKIFTLLLDFEDTETNNMSTLFNVSKEKMFANLVAFKSQIQNGGEFDVLQELKKFYQQDKFRQDALFARCFAYFSYFKNLYALDLQALGNDTLNIRAINHYLKNNRKKIYQKTLSKLADENHKVVYVLVYCLKNSMVLNEEAEFAIPLLLNAASTWGKKITIGESPIRSSIFLRIAKDIFRLIETIPPALFSNKDKYCELVLELEKKGIWRHCSGFVDALKKISPPKSRYTELIDVLTIEEASSWETTRKNLKFLSELRSQKFSKEEFLPQMGQAIEVFLQLPSPTEADFANLLKTIDLSYLSNEQTEHLLKKIPTIPINLVHLVTDPRFDNYVHCFYEEAPLSDQQKQDLFEEAFADFKQNGEYQLFFYTRHLTDQHFSRIMDVCIEKVKQNQYSDGLEHAILWANKVKALCKATFDRKQKETFITTVIEKVQESNTDIRDAAYEFIKEILSNPNWKTLVSNKRIEQLIEISIKNFDTPDCYSDRNAYMVPEFFNAIDIPNHLKNAVFLCLFKKLRCYMKILAVTNASDLSRILIGLNKGMAKVATIPVDLLDEAIDMLTKMMQFEHLKKTAAAWIPVFHVELPKEKKEEVFQILFELSKDQCHLQQFVVLPVAKEKYQEIETELLATLQQLTQDSMKPDVLPTIPNEWSNCFDERGNMIVQHLLDTSTNYLRQWSNYYVKLNQSMDKIKDMIDALCLMALLNKLPNSKKSIRTFEEIYDVLYQLPSDEALKISCYAQIKLDAIRNMVPEQFHPLLIEHSRRLEMLDELKVQLIPEVAKDCTGEISRFAIRH